MSSRTAAVTRTTAASGTKQRFNDLAAQIAEEKFFGTTPSAALVVALTAAAGRLKTFCPIGVTTEDWLPERLRTVYGRAANDQCALVIPAEFVRLDGSNAIVRDSARIRRLSSHPDRTRSVPLERLRAVARTTFNRPT